MTHPLYKSRAGRILYRELPEAIRTYDNRDPGVSAIGEAADAVTEHVLGDLEAFLFGCGHLLDRFDATLRQFHADGVLEEIGPVGDEKAIQGWLLPYVAELFGVELLAPDSESRRRELATSIWLARRRGTKTAVDVSAEMITGQTTVVVTGASRILQTPSVRTRPVTHRDLTGFWHPDDERILNEALPAPSPAQPHVEGFLARRGAAHAGLSVGTPLARTAMRAHQADLSMPDAEVRMAQGDALGDPRKLRPFVVRDRRGRPCFPDTHEDRSLRTPDMRAPRANRPRFTHLKKPDGITVFVEPPVGMFTGQETRLGTPPEIEDGRIKLDDVPAGGSLSDLFYDDETDVLVLDGTNAGPGNEYVLEGFKFAGTLKISGDVTVTINDCALRSILGPDAADGSGARISAQNSIFRTIDLSSHEPASSEVILEYCTVTTSATFWVAKVSDSIMAGTFVAGGDGASEKPGCVRYSAVPLGFDPEHVHRFESVEAAPVFLRWPCILRGGVTVADAVPQFGEPGYGVLSDRVARAIREGAENGGEMGVYNGAWHLARLAAAARKAEGYLPVGKQVFAHYDPRLLAPLPELAT